MKLPSLSLVLILALAGSAAPAEPLTRAQAVAAALEANPVVGKSREELARLEGLVQEAKADALPELTLHGTFIRYRDPALLNSSSFDSFPAELRDSLVPVPANLYEGVASLRQTLFSFKLGSAIRAARYGRSYGEEELARARQAVSLQAIRAYDDYLLSLEQVRVAEDALHQKQEHLQMAKSRRDAGVATDLEVLRSQVDVANQKTQLLRMRGQADLARSALNAVMVRPVDAPVEPVDRLAYVPLDVSLDEAVAAALAGRPEMKALELAEKVQDQLVAVARAESRPSLEFNGSWGYSVRQPSNFLSGEFQKWSASVSLKVPVFDGFRTAGRVAQAKADRRKLGQDQVALENQIRLEAKDAVDRLRVAAQVLEAAELNVTQARKARDMTEANYRQGAATTLDVLDTQTALTLAESLRIEALHAHASARATLLYVMGQDPLGRPLETKP